MKKIALVLSGCGYLDGAEITEATSLLIALSQLGAKVTVFAPNLEVDETNHLTKESTGQKINTLQMAARIARSEAHDIQTLDSKLFDGLAFAGGYGAALHLSTWAKEGAKASVNPSVKKVILDFYNSSKPILAVCIAPALIALTLGDKHVTLTAGNDLEVKSEFQKTGAVFEDCPVDDFITDREHKVITTPAYMYEAKPHEVFIGIIGAAKELVEMA